MSEIKITPLGAGQDVGRSCILASIGDKHIMLDCGMHMGFNDERRFPDFSYIAEGNLTEHLDCVIISHFHLDHCGALPYMTEMVGYTGPIYMTQPTKALCPVLLEDMRKVAVERKGETNFFTSSMIKDCMKKVTTVALHETVKVDDELEIKAYYAGHVLGAAMFHVKVGNHSLVYTGDYNMTPDRHLGAAWIDKCRPDLLITESTYATTIRDSKRCRERDFLKKIHSCVDRGGKVLIPVFALGRVQELCILLDTYWDRMNLTVPVYFTMGLAETANKYYRMFITWTNQKIRRTFVHRNMFDFKHIKPFDKSYIDNPGPMVVFATPGMLHAGLSLAVFKKWAPQEQNMVIMPGYCVQGTVGHKILNGAKVVEIDKQNIQVKLAVEYMSFSAHADAKGIMQLIRHCQPSNVLLVHGENAKMDFLKQKIMQEFNINCYKPGNGETAVIGVENRLRVEVSLPLLQQCLAQHALSQHGGEELTKGSSKRAADAPHELTPVRKAQKLLHGVLIIKNDSVRVSRVCDAWQELGVTPHQLRYTQRVELPLHATAAHTSITHMLHTSLSRLHSTLKLVIIPKTFSLIWSPKNPITLLVSYTHQDEALGARVLDAVTRIFKLPSS
ncbi:integrator complex subunit 11 [Hyalella azteca]|uniref:Integrator complex subunit 11 n=1 Tax=Hyalella azteca TaxID=294128 RepID=A0A979FQZ6_HYAAZ|nr:integrator complex subunit 11 [Hyalella azteca]